MDQFQSIALIVAGLMLFAAGRWAAGAAERRACRHYCDIVGEENAARQIPTDGWNDLRPLVGPWGCLVALLALAQGLGVALTILALLHGCIGPA